MADAASAAIAAIITIIPFYLALTIPRFQFLMKNPQAFAALAMGMSLLFFLEPLHDTNGLGLFSPSFGFLELELVATFVVVFIVLTLGGSQGGAWPLWVIGAGIAIHSFSESSVLVNAIPLYLGNIAIAIPNAVSFVLHKFLEGFVLVAFSASLGIQRFRQLVFGALPLALLSVGGALSSFLPPFDLTPLIAAGAGGWTFALLSLGPSFDGRNRPVMYVLVVVGFIIVYSLGLLHSANFD